MSDVDLDEDLLALAGAGGGSDSEIEVERRPKSGVKRSASAVEVDDEDDEDDDDYHIEDVDEIGKDDDDENGDGEGSGTKAPKNPYPLEGKYIDEEDRVRIESMDEMAREEILYTRAQEMNDYNERLYLAQRMAREKKQVQSERSSRAKKVKESSTRSKKTKKLSELKKQRDRKAKKEAGDDYSAGEDEEEEEEEDDDDYDAERAYDDYDMDEEEAGDDDDYDPDYVAWGTGESGTRDRASQRPVTVGDINRICVNRRQVLKYLYYPEFQDVVQDCFARFNIGMNKQTRQPTYRMVKILSIEQGRKPYKLERSFVRDYAVCSVGKGEPKKVSMDFFSNSPLTEEEFEKYQEYQGALPSLKKVERKYNELKQMATRVLTTAELKKVTDKKQELNRDYTGANAVVRRAEISTELEVARQKYPPDHEEITRLEAELEKYESARQRENDKYNKYDKLNALDKVNERNRKSNQEAVRRAEQLASEKRRKDASAGVMANPFSRLKTNVRLYYQNAQHEMAQKAALEKEEQAELDKKKELAQSKYFDKAKYRQGAELDAIVRDRVNVVFNV